MPGKSEEIIAILATVIGPGLARSAVSMQCKKMEILPENLSGTTLVEFADRLRVPLQYFAGPAAADDVVERIKALESPPDTKPAQGRQAA